MTRSNSRFSKTEKMRFERLFKLDWARLDYFSRSRGSSRSIQLFKNMSSKIIMIDDWHFIVNVMFQVQIKLEKYDAN